MTRSITILIDHREKAPYAFTGLGVEVVTRQVTLWAGDYALDVVLPCDEAAVERKSLMDLYSTLSMRDRRRLFELELARLDTMRGGAVVVEAIWQEAEPPARVGMSTADLSRMVERLRGAWPRVTWLACDGRREAEVATLEWLVKHQRWIEAEKGS